MFSRWFAMALTRRLFSLVIFCSLVPVPSILHALQKGGSAIQDEVVLHFGAGQQAMQTGHFDRAVEQFKEVLRLRPDLVEARVDLGLAYHALGDYTLAVSELGQAARQRSDLLPANLFLGISYLKLGSPEQAIPPLDRALAIDPSNREARRALATAELSQGNYGEAAAQFRKLSNTNPDKADAWFQLGHDYLQMSKGLTTRLSQRFPDSAWSLRLAGDVLAERRLYNDAGFAYGKALQADPAQLGIHSALGKTLLREGKVGEADTQFKAELARNPFEPTALLGSAQVQLLDGNPRQALERIARIEKSNPEILAQGTLDFTEVNLPVDSARRMAAELAGAAKDPAREFLLSALDRMAGDAGRAQEVQPNFGESAEPAGGANPKASVLSRSACDHNRERLCAEFLRSQKRLDSGDLLRLGRSLFVLHQDEAASDSFAEALQQNPRSEEAAYWLNRSYLRLAEARFNRLTTADPDSWRAHELKGEALHLRHADQDAVTEYRAAEQLNPDDPKIHEALGEILLAENAPQEAKSELQKALQLNPTAARSLYLMGRLYVAQRDPASAIPYLEAALRYDPTLVEAHSVLGKAYLKVGKPDLAAAQLERSTKVDRYGDLNYLLYQAYREAGKSELAARALARSQELRRKSAADDQAKIRPANEE